MQKTRLIQTEQTKENKVLIGLKSQVVKVTPLIKYTQKTSFVDSYPNNSDLRYPSL
jgi:hypothetical protein